MIIDMLASYLARQYAMYAICNQYQQHGTNLVIPSVCFQSHLNLPEVGTSTRTTGCGHSEGTSGHVDAPGCSKRKTKSSSQRKKMSPEIKFSIDRILGKSDSEETTKDGVEEGDETGGPVHVKEEVINMMEFSPEDEMNFSWLNCTRYKPPKLQRMRKKDGGKKRKLGRNPRVPFSQQQVAALEQKFCRTHYLSSMDVAELSTALNLTETRVKIWFQNRRARERRDRDAKRRLSAELDHPKVDDHTAYTTTTSTSTSSWRMSMAESTASFSPFKDAVHAGTSAFSPVSFNCKN